MGTVPPSVSAIGSGIMNIKNLSAAPASGADSSGDFSSSNV